MDIVVSEKSKAAIFAAIEKHSVGLDGVASIRGFTGDAHFVGSFGIQRKLNDLPDGLIPLRHVEEEKEEVEENRWWRTWFLKPRLRKWKEEWVEVECLGGSSCCGYTRVLRLKPEKVGKVMVEFGFLAKVEEGPDGFGIYLGICSGAHVYSRPYGKRVTLHQEAVLDYGRLIGGITEARLLPLVKVQWGRDIMIVTPEEILEIQRRGCVVLAE